MFDRVLVPVDASDFPERIVPYVRYIAKTLSSSVTLLSVIAPWQSSGAEELASRRYLERLKVRLVDRSIRTTSMISYGYPAAGILRVADEEECDLIAMATHARGILGRIMHGSVAESVIRSSSIPVLTICRQHPEGCNGDRIFMSRIIVPLDGTPFAEAVLPVAEELARKLSVGLVTVRVIDTGEPYAATLDDVSSTRLDPNAQREAVSYLHEVTRNLKAKGLNVQPRLFVGSPGQAILDLTNEAPSVVVIASHGRTGFDRWTEGSVTHTLVRKSQGPVLVVPPHRA